MATNGSMFDLCGATGQPRFRYCVERDSASAVWKLANNTGAAMHVSGVGDPDAIVVAPSGNLLTDMFFRQKNGSGPYPGGAYVPPGGTVSVRLPQGRTAATVRASVDAPINASAYTLRQFDRVLPDNELVERRCRQCDLTTDPFGLARC